MRNGIITFGLIAALIALAPALALAGQADTNIGDFKALMAVAAPVQLGDEELAAIEGAGGCDSCGGGGTFMLQAQSGLVNVGFQTNTGNTNIASGNNIAILSNANQSSHLH